MTVTEATRRDRDRPVATTAEIAATIAEHGRTLLAALKAAEVDLGLVAAEHDHASRWLDRWLRRLARGFASPGVLRFFHAIDAAGLRLVVVPDAVDASAPQEYSHEAAHSVLADLARAIRGLQAWGDADLDARLASNRLVFAEQRPTLLHLLVRLWLRVGAVPALVPLQDHDRVVAALNASGRHRAPGLRSGAGCGDLAWVRALVEETDAASGPYRDLEMDRIHDFSIHDEQPLPYPETPLGVLGHAEAERRAVSEFFGSPEEAADAASRRRLLTRMLSTALDPRSERIARLRCGLAAAYDDDHDFARAGERLDISRERVRQIVKKSEEKLLRRAWREGLRPVRFPTDDPTAVGLPKGFGRAPTRKLPTDAEPPPAPAVRDRAPPATRPPRGIPAFLTSAPSAPLDLPRFLPRRSAPSEYRVGTPLLDPDAGLARIVLGIESLGASDARKGRARQRKAEPALARGGDLPAFLPWRAPDSAPSRPARKGSIRRGGIGDAIGASSSSVAALLRGGLIVPASRAEYALPELYDLGQIDGFVGRLLKRVRRGQPGFYHHRLADAARVMSVPEEDIVRLLLDGTLSGARFGDGRGEYGSVMVDVVEIESAMPCPTGRLPIWRAAPMLGLDEDVAQRLAEEGLFGPVRRLASGDLFLDRAGVLGFAEKYVAVGNIVRCGYGVGTVIDLLMKAGVEPVLKPHTLRYSANIYGRSAAERLFPYGPKSAKKSPKKRPKLPGRRGRKPAARHRVEPGLFMNFPVRVAIDAD